ncbi:hypothetical protein DFJ73DRAFT_811158 [Zopfochytrium polystomum]|nr:hypothetical protein DFJ73DRAFT_811158 [Zopfochytrium polystomum]
MMPRTKAAEPLLRVPAATHLKQQQQQPPPPLQLRYSLAAPAVRTNPQDVAVLRAVVTLATSSPGHPSDHSSEASLLNVLRALHAVTSADYEARTRADAVRTLLVSLFRQFPKLEWMERLDKVEKVGFENPPPCQSKFKVRLSKFPNTDVSSVSLPTGMFEDPSTSFLPAGPTLVEPSSILSASHGLYSSRPGPMIPPVPSSLAIPKFQSSFRGRDFVTASRVFDAWRRITAESRNSRKRIVKTWLTSAEYWQKRLIERCFIAWHEAYRSRKISHERLLCRIAFEAFQQNAQSIRESINRFQSGVGLRKWFICWKAKASLHRTRKRRLDVAEELFGRSMRKNTQLHAFQLWRKKILERTDVQDLSDVAWKLSRSQVLKKHFELWRNRCLHACTLASLQRERQLVTLKTILLKWNAETKRRAQVFDMINHAGKDFGTRLKTRIFNAWRQTAKSRRLQKRLLLMEESKGIIVQQFIFSTWQIRWLSAREARRFVLRKYFSTWLVRTAKQKQSREFSQRLASIRQRHLVQTALRIWLQRWQRMTQRLSDWSKAASARIQSAVFKLWTRNYQARRSSSFDRRRLLEQAFSLWTAAYMDRSQWVQAATAYSGARIVVNTLKIWVAERRRRQLIFAAAEEIFKGE